MIINLVIDVSRLLIIVRLSPYVYLRFKFALLWCLMLLPATEPST